MGYVMDLKKEKEMDMYMRKEFESFFISAVVAGIVVGVIFAEPHAWRSGPSNRRAQQSI